MSATQELIAAALTAADELDFIHKHAPIEHTTDELREACARAMVQPEAPDMAEVERRLETYEEACRSGQWEPERTALLDYVRGVIVERDALMLEFCPQEMTEVQKEKWARNQQPVGEVPMPEQAGWAVEMHGACVLFANNAEKAAGRSPGAKTRVYTEAQALAMMRTYGEAREAAGYAAGVAAVRDYAVMRWCAEVSNRPLVNTHRRTLDDTWRQVIRHTGGDPETLIGPCHDVLVALRGEVKP